MCLCRSGGERSVRKVGTRAYSGSADVEAQYGIDNVSKWEDINNNENAAEITARITFAIVEADDMIDSMLRGGPYTIPWTSPPVGIVSLSAMYAGVWLYSARGVTDYDSEGKAVDQLQHHRKLFSERIRDILAGRYQPEAYPTVVKSYPEVYES